MFNAHPVLRTNDLETSQRIHEAAQLDLNPTQPAAHNETISSYANVRVGAQLDCYHFRYSHDMALNALSENPHYWVAIALNTKTRQRPRAVPILTRLASPGQDDTFVVRGNQDMLGMRLDGHKLQVFAENWLGISSLDRLTFAPDFQLRSPAERSVAQLMIMAAEEDALDPTALSDPHRQNGLFQSIASTLLAFRPHTASKRIPNLRYGPAPKDIKRVVDFIHESAHKNVTLADLVAVSGVPGRTLTYHFSIFVGQSPMGYLRTCRLDAIREGLRLGRFETVTEAATAYGITAFGRLSRQYKERFGELPSATLARKNGAGFREGKAST